MTTKTSEKKLAMGIVCLAVGVFILFTPPLITTPVWVSEKGILFTIVALYLIALGVRLCKRSMVKV